MLCCSFDWTACFRNLKAGLDYAAVFLDPSLVQMIVEQIWQSLKSFQITAKFAFRVLDVESLGDNLLEPLGARRRDFGQHLTNKKSIELSFNMLIQHAQLESASKSI